MLDPRHDERRDRGDEKQGAFGNAESQRSQATNSEADLRARAASKRAHHYEGGYEDQCDEDY